MRAVTGNKAMPGFTAPKLLWIATHEPGIFAAKSFNAGTSTRAGLFARPEAQSLDAFADRIQSYCDTGDNFCAGGNNLQVHLGYTRKYNNVAEEFVLEKIGG